jgi:hypothetical protein
MLQRRPVDTARDEKRRADARRSVATRRERERLGLPSLRSLARPEATEAGRQQDYTQLDAVQLCELLPGEQWLLDMWVSGMQARLTRDRIAAIEAELRGHGLDEETINAHRFGVAEYDADAATIAERRAISLEERAEPWMLAEALHFAPEDFVS